MSIFCSCGFLYSDSLESGLDAETRTIWESEFPIDDTCDGSLFVIAWAKDALSVIPHLP